MSKLPGTARKALSVAVAAADLIGESPVWSAREQALYWADVFVRYLGAANLQLRIRFGRTVYVTSASMRLSAEERLSQPLAGHVFAIEPGAVGLPELCFAG